MSSKPILRVTGPEGQEQSFVLEHSEYSVGREDGREREKHLSISHDLLLSRHHLDIKWDTDRLLVRRASGAKNPVFYQGQECNRFVLEPGQSFMSGKSRFLLLASGSIESAGPTTELTLSRHQVQGLMRPNLQECFRALVDMLPHLRTCTDRDDAFREALRVLKEMIPGAAEFSVLELGHDIRVLADERAEGRGVSTPPSRRLLQRAFQLSSTVTHVWAKAELADAESMMTSHSQADWAMASPIEVAGTEKFGLYVVGSARGALTDAEAKVQKNFLDGLASLVDIVAETLGHHLAVARFNRIEGQVTKFFSPVLRKSLAGSDFNNVLDPKRRRVTVMFFDLRGFSKATEKAQDGLDSILDHHGVLTDVMTTVTNCVFAEGGVVVDYQGDAVMACWGALAEDCEAAKAIRAARTIVEKISAMPLPFGDSATQRCGLGIATGDVIAGQVGAQEQTKFGVLGPTVNLAARLEGLTKYFGVPILINSETRRELGEGPLCRRIGLVRPAGLTEACELFELVLPKQHGGSGLAPEEISIFEQASRCYADGCMEEAYETLMSGTRATDPIARFLARHILDHLDHGVPRSFDGVLSFKSK